MKNAPIGRGWGVDLTTLFFTLTPSYSYTGALSPQKYRLEMKKF
ncbi:hypothetical protein VCHA38P215_370002 [Vibrio chagasii]|nr:hypothetical protein VCHA38P215_370002 [Vibrio chagasii]CAK3009388.1 hypothetical protein VCRA2120O56_420004 [Vibrio crassostreae]